MNDEDVQSARIYEIPGKWFWKLSYEVYYPYKNNKHNFVALDDVDFSNIFSLNCRGWKLSSIKFGEVFDKDEPTVSVFLAATKTPCGRYWQCLS